MPYLLPSLTCSTCAALCQLLCASQKPSGFPRTVVGTSNFCLDGNCAEGVQMLRGRVWTGDLTAFLWESSTRRGCSTRKPFSAASSVCASAGSCSLHAIRDEDYIAGGRAGRDAHVSVNLFLSGRDLHVPSHSTLSCGVENSNSSITSKYRLWQQCLLSRSKSRMRPMSTIH